MIAMKARYGKKGVKRGLTAGGRGESIMTHFQHSLRDKPIRWTTKAPPEEKKPQFVKRVMDRGSEIVLLVYRCKGCRGRFWDRHLTGKRDHLCRMCSMRDSNRKLPSWVLPLTNAEIADLDRYMRDQGVTVTSRSQLDLTASMQH